MNRTAKIPLGHLRHLSQNAPHTHLSSATTTRLSGHRLALARLGSMALAALTLTTFLPLLPVYLGYLHTVCVAAACPVGQLTPQAVEALQVVGLSFNAFVASTLVLTLLALLMCWSVAVVIAWRKSDDWMALLVAVMLVLMGTSYVTHLLLQQPSPWQIPALLLELLTFGVFFLVFCLFPSGRFVPPWLRWLPVGWIIWGVVTISLRAVPGFYSLHLLGFLAGIDRDCECASLPLSPHLHGGRAPTDQVGRLGCVSRRGGCGGPLLARGAGSRTRRAELALSLARRASADPGSVPGFPFDWHGDPTLSSLGHRYADQSYSRLWDAHGEPRLPLCWPGHGAPIPPAGVLQLH